MNYKRFYKRLFAPLVAEFGPIDRDTIFAIMGFDGGGPLSFSTIGAQNNDVPIIYISCELAVRDEQVPSSRGRYEFLCECDDEDWVRSIVSKLGQMSLHARFGHGHIIDIGACVDSAAPIQGIVLERECETQIDGESFCIYRVIGITRREMKLRHKRGLKALRAVLRKAGVYPKTICRRKSAV